MQLKGIQQVGVIGLGVTGVFPVSILTASLKLSTPMDNINARSGMPVFDLVEMVADWMVVAAQNNKNGNFKPILEHAAARFEIGPQLLAILTNIEKMFFRHG